MNRRRRYRAQQPTKKQNDFAKYAVIIGLVCLAALIVFRPRAAPTPNPGPSPEPIPIVDDQTNPPEPTPPDPQPAVRSLDGYVVFIWNMNPLSADQKKVYLDAKALEASGDTSVRMYDCTDGSDAMKNVLAKAKEAGVEPPFVYHKPGGDGDTIFVPMKGNWPTIKTELEK